MIHIIRRQHLRDVEFILDAGHDYVETFTINMDLLNIASDLGQYYQRFRRFAPDHVPVWDSHLEFPVTIATVAEFRELRRMAAAAIAADLASYEFHRVGLARAIAEGSVLV